ncbi:hypothetical protein [Streptomyces tendae]
MGFGYTHCAVDDHTRLPPPAVAFFTAHGSDHSSPGRLAFLHTHNRHH